MPPVADNNKKQSLKTFVPIHVIHVNPFMLQTYAFCSSVHVYLIAVALGTFGNHAIHKCFCPLVMTPSE